MPLLLQCLEPQGRPPVVALPLEAGGSFAVYALADALEGDRGLRATVLRGAGQFPPDGAVLILEGSASVGNAATLPPLRVSRVGPDVLVDLLRPELRSRVAVGTLLRSGSRLEVALPNQRRLSFALQLEMVGAGGEVRASVGGSGTRSSQALASSRGAMWLLPTAWKLLTDLTDVAIENAVKLGRRLGLTTRTMVYATTLWFFIIGAVIAFYTQSNAKAEAQGQVVQTQEQLDRAEKARQVALAGEASCLVERSAIATELGAADQTRALQAEQALGLTASQGKAIEIGGSRMGTDEVHRYDAPAAKSAQDEVVRQTRLLPPPGSTADACLAFDVVLGADLPRYALLLFPTADLVCPLDYKAVVGGVALAGRWGLSERVAAEFGTPDAALEGALSETSGDASPDLRVNDRWSASALASGLRAIQDALLRHEGGGRLPVSPSQAQLWSLALFSAYNRMPSPAEGALDASGPTCVKQVLDDAVSNAGPAAPGQPLLPDLVAVANDEVVVPARPTPGCPWPPDAMAEGARAAIRAAARLASVPPARSP